MLHCFIVPRKTFTSSVLGTLDMRAMCMLRCTAVVHGRINESSLSCKVHSELSTPGCSRSSCLTLWWLAVVALRRHVLARLFGMGRVAGRRNLWCTISVRDHAACVCNVCVCPRACTCVACVACCSSCEGSQCQVMTVMTYA